MVPGDRYIFLRVGGARARNMLSASFTHLDSGGHELPSRLPAQSSGRPSYDAARRTWRLDDSGDSGW